MCMSAWSARTEVLTVRERIQYTASSAICRWWHAIGHRYRFDSRHSMPRSFALAPSKTPIAKEGRLNIISLARLRAVGRVSSLAAANAAAAGQQTLHATPEPQKIKKSAVHC